MEEHFDSAKFKDSHLKDLPLNWEQFLMDSQIENFLRHDLRHTFASRLVMAGVDIYNVIKLMGHMSITSTVRYAHLVPKYLQDAVDVLSKKSVSKPAPKTALAKNA
jgi:integrase